MLSSNDIKNVRFSRAVSGYKLEEVEAFLDKIEADFINYEKITSEYQLKIDTLNKEIEEYKISQNSLQNVLISAQKLADDIVSDAKLKGEEIIKEATEKVADINNRAQFLTQNFDSEIALKKAQAEQEIKNMIDNANKKAEAITLASADCVARQQALFDRLKEEISKFKGDITSAYKEHLEFLKQIPTTVSMEPSMVAEILSNEIDKENAQKEEVVEEEALVEEENIEVEQEEEAQDFEEAEE